MSHRIGPRRNGFLTLFLSLLSSFNALSVHAAMLQIEVERTVEKKTLMGMGQATSSLQRTSIGQYPVGELAKRKTSELTEIDPDSRSRAKFQGVSLSDLVNEATAKLTAEDRAHFDLVVLESQDGRVAYMPKAFLVKYPSIQLALKKDGKDLGPAAPRVVLPATSNSKIQRENMILEPLFLSGLKSVTLTSYEERFGTFLLARRTDPAAMRGEKLFLQNCVGCHGNGPTAPGRGLSDRLSVIQAKGHPVVPKVGPIPTRLEKKDVRSLTSYLDAFKMQTAAK